jgi:hypothetical protein
MSNLVLRTATRTRDEVKEAIDALNEKFNSYESIGAIFADTDFVYKAGTLIRQLAQDTFMGTDPTDLILTRRQGAALGDWIEFEEYVNTAKVVERSLGGKSRIFTPHKNVYPITPTDWRIDFGFELEKVATKQIDVSVWVSQMAEAISRYYITSVLDAVDTACATGVTDAYSRAVRTAVSTNVDETTIDTALRRLGDVNENAVIMGRYYALYPIFKLQNNGSYDPTASDELRARGAVTKFRGATVVVLRDSYNPFFSSATIPVNRIYISGADKGGVLAETDMSAFNYSTVDTEEQHFRTGVKGRTAFAVTHPWKYHVIQIN